MRARLALAGITDPLRQLGSLHAVLDVIEHMATENADEKHLDSLYASLYRPDPRDAGTDSGMAEAESSFDAFLAMAGG